MPLPIILYAVGAAAAAYTAKKGYDYYSEKEEEQKEKERAREKQEREEAILRARKGMDSFEGEWAERFSSLLLVDSNIWMNPEYDEFFSSLEWVMERFSSIISMPSKQFDEIVNLKNLPYGNPKSKLARCALGRIEYFQNRSLIRIVPMGFNAEKNAYADPDIIEILVDSLAKYTAMTLVSDDRELRIRANQILKDKEAPSFRAIEGGDIHKLIMEYQSNVEMVS